ncbi:aldose 1-epimerase [Buttiauxella sp. WJP83]|uniref:aldose 1-epimerase n=1 Tax=Buttiauxella sp. WJP83 TaxID=2986951 RepID=UPI0022DE309F|nr:aldose 1-epimerase [Buttiauxella sp. WJP83]WBM71657.1 aldose 1-epimerase [Buttiauxella sp. WJP83]
METLLLENEFLRLTVAPQGAAIRSLDSKIHQQPILHAGEKALFPMLPLANRVAGNAFTLHGERIELPDSEADAQFFLHGDGWLKSWRVETHDASHITLSLESRHSCGFDYQARLTYRLEGRCLIAELQLTHLGSKAMVYGLGFHPFFHLTPATHVQFSATGFWPEGENHLPKEWLGELTAPTNFIKPKIPDNQWLNVGYSGWSGSALIERGDMRIQLTSPTPYLMVFRMPDEPFICLEPQSHPVNAHNMAGQPGLVLLERQQSTVMKMEIAVV